LQFFKFVKTKTLSFKERRGISQIMGALLMLAIVVPIGSVILVNGVIEISAFNNSMSNTVEHRNNGIQENIIFEHIRFVPTSNAVEISILNIGSVETVIDRITLVNMTNQDILYKIDSLSTFNPKTLSIKNSTELNIDADLAACCWNVGSTPTAHEYKISIITSRGNFFDTVARPYNT